jgi:DNA-binding MarR family transcriptional regulator
MAVSVGNPLLFSGKNGPEYRRADKDPGSDFCGSSLSQSSDIFVWTTVVLMNILDRMATSPKTRHFDSLQQEAFLNLWRTYDRLRAAEDALFNSYDLTPQQYNALRLLRGEHPGTLPTLTLAARLVSHAPDVTRLVDKLVARGLANRERPEHNRRIVLVGISEEGIRLLKDLDRPVRECHLKQLGHLAGNDLQHLIKLLRAARAPHETAEGPWS